jgi:hypothetical protein
MIIPMHFIERMSCLYRSEMMDPCRPGTTKSRAQESLSSTGLEGNDAVSARL